MSDEDDTKLEYTDLDEEEQREVETAFAETAQARLEGRLVSQEQINRRISEVLANYDTRMTQSEIRQFFSRR